MNIKNSFLILLISFGLVLRAEPVEIGKSEEQNAKEKSVALTNYMNALAASWAQKRPKPVSASPHLLGLSGIGFGAIAFYLGCVLDSRIATVASGGVALASGYSLCFANKSLEMYQTIEKIDRAYANVVLKLLMQHQDVRMVQAQLTSEAQQLLAITVCLCEEQMQ